MKIAHLADLHLGHRRFPAMTRERRNQREQDVSDAFRVCVDGLIAAQVDLVLIAGDVFDTGRPSNAADADAVRGLLRIRHALPHVPILIIEGNHDVAIDGGSPLAILAHVGAKVVLHAERVALPSLNAHVLCVPERDVHRVALEPSSDAGTHLLLAHGRFSASLYRLPEADCLSPDRIHPDFAYAALGDFHTAAQVGPRAWYAGSTEWTSSNVWGELGTEKGWLLADTETGTVTRQLVPTRPHLDLPPLSADALTPEDLTTAVLANVAAVDVTGAVVRQVVHDMRRGVRGDMDARAIRRAVAECLHFQLDERRPVAVQAGAFAVAAAVVEDDGPDWIDEFNRDEPVAVIDDCSYADAIMHGALPMLDPNADPYHLNDTAARKQEAA